MKKVTVIIATMLIGVLALTSCKKENVEPDKPLFYTFQFNSVGVASEKIWIKPSELEKVNRQEMIKSINNINNGEQTYICVSKVEDFNTNEVIVKYKNVLNNFDETLEFHYAIAPSNLKTYINYQFFGTHKHKFILQD